MWSNFHTHSAYCDGTGALRDYAGRAVMAGMASVGFSSHAPLPFACKWCMPAEKLPHYLDEIKVLKASFEALQFYAGLEVDFIPGIIRPTDFAGMLDYTIGSVHFVDTLPDGTPWEIDGPHTLFLEGYEKIFKSDSKATMLRYLALTLEMIETACPTVVGHLDKIKIQNLDNKLFREDDHWYRQAMEGILDAISRKGAILEVNTRGLYQQKSTTPYPSPWVLELALKKNIPITLSSDAHHPKDLTNQFFEMAPLLAAIGFKTLTVLYNGAWQPFSFNNHGITLR